MCKILKGTRPPISRWNGEWITLSKGYAVNHLARDTETKLECIHADGRSDTYSLKLGERLVIDEDGTKIRMLNPEDFIL